MQLVLVACLSFAAVVHQVGTSAASTRSKKICSELGTFNYANAFKEADIVFKGGATSGISGVGIDENGTTIVGASYDFKVQRYFKDNTGRKAEQVTVNQVYTMGGQCDPTVYNGFPDLLVFAKDNNGFQLNGCIPVVPWQCVPAKVIKDFVKQNS